MEQAMTFMQRWRVRLGHLFTLVLLLTTGHPGYAALLAGTAISLVGEMIRIAAAGQIDKDETLSRKGLYAYVRNPLYVGSFLMSLGFCVACANIWVLIAFFIFFFTVYTATVMKEEQFLAKKFGAEFERFRAEVPRFVPRLTPAPGNTRGNFSWRRAMENREYEGAIATVIVLALLWAMALAGFSPVEALLGKR